VFSAKKKLALPSSGLVIPLLEERSLLIKRILCIGIAASLTTCLAPCQQILADGTQEPEAKRILGIVPNYRTSPSIQDSEPLTIGEKFKIASDDSFDRGTVALAAIFAGQSQLTNANRSFGQGGAGYARYFGTAYGDFVIGNYMTEGVFPTLLHQDPRYFRRGIGSGWSRLGYAMKQIFWTHRDSGFEDLARLGYTERVIQESMRIYPPAWVFARTPVEDDVIGGYHIPAKSLVVISPYVTHRLPDLWENPEIFDPDRFLPKRSEGRPRFAYYPFSAGPRQCVGASMATLEAQMIISMTAQRYQLSAPPGLSPGLKPRISLTADRTLWLTPVSRACAGSAVTDR